MRRRSLDVKDQQRAVARRCNRLARRCPPYLSMTLNFFSNLLLTSFIFVLLQHLWVSVHFISFNTVVTQVWCPISTKYSFVPTFYLHNFKYSSMQTSYFYRSCPPRFAKLSLSSSKISINFLQVCSSETSEYISKGRGSVTPAVLGTSASIHVVPVLHSKPQPSLHS